MVPAHLPSHLIGPRTPLAGIPGGRWGWVLEHPWVGPRAAVAPGGLRALGQPEQNNCGMAAAQRASEVANRGE